ncbi:MULTISPECIES: hypothetical protein, partial [unclassified Vibrio]|uniref:hypothetical protein n=1 Tax=unclassified Vibrio TaxID=2614977 RepID=UPI00354DA49E
QLGNKASSMFHGLVSIESEWRESYREFLIIKCPWLLSCLNVIPVPFEVVVGIQLVNKGLRIHSQTKQFT